MELHDQIQQGTLATLQTIAASLKAHGITVTPPAKPHCCLDWNTMEGQFQGATIRASLSTHSRRLNLTWGPYLQSLMIGSVTTTNYATIKCAAESYDALLTKFLRLLRKLPTGTIRGQQATLYKIAQELKQAPTYGLVADLRRQLNMGLGTGHDSYRYPIDLNNPTLVNALNGKDVQQFIQAYDFP
jgi:hypothetical protein